MLERTRELLDGCIGCGCLSLDRCVLYNRGDKAARGGAGPRYLLGDRAQDFADPVEPKARRVGRAPQAGRARPGLVAKSRYGRA